MKVLVIGDLIVDHYRFGQATRLCPEGPVPVIVPDDFQSVRTTRGGAGLVTDQLRALIGHENVIAHFGSKSRKERIFADGRLICRVDYDSLYVSDSHAYERAIVKSLKSSEVSILIVADYGKGAITQTMAERIMQATYIMGIPVLVDAKSHSHFYRGAYAFFPNQHEFITTGPESKFHTIQKLGARGCSVNGVEIRPQSGHPVRDVTGAGDVFLAAFAAAMYRSFFTSDIPEQQLLEMYAAYANRIAGLSVESVGTTIVSDL